MERTLYEGKEKGFYSYNRLCDYFRRIGAEEIEHREQGTTPYEFALGAYLIKRFPFRKMDVRVETTVHPDGHHLELLVLGSEGLIKNLEEDLQREAGDTLNSGV